MLRSRAALLQATEMRSPQMWGASPLFAAMRHGFGRPAGTTENSPALECWVRGDSTRKSRRDDRVSGKLGRLGLPSLSGLGASPSPDPALKCWAIFKCPCGTAEIGWVLRKTELRPLETRWRQPACIRRVQIAPRRVCKRFLRVGSRFLRNRKGFIRLKKPLLQLQKRFLRDKRRLLRIRETLLRRRSRIPTRRNVVPIRRSLSKIRRSRSPTRRNVAPI